MIEIRPYMQQDWPALMQIHDHARPIELHLAGLDDAFIPLSEAAFTKGLFDYTIDVAVLEKRPVGFVAYSQTELAWLYVHPGFLRMGIGRSLVSHVLKRNANESVHIEVLYGNEPAKKLYEQMGFVVYDNAQGVMPGNESFPVKVYCMKINRPAKTVALNANEERP